MIVEPARAKLNLALHVRGRRADGYHEIETLFAFVADGDEIRIAPAETDSFAVSGPFAAALADEGDNLVTRAAAAFAEAFGGGHHAIALDKKLPVASGIGGGSADAAATLRGMARLHDVSIGDARLIACAEALGSDVPACLLGRTAIGRGRGERLEPVAGMSGVPALLVNPGVAVPTGQVFARWDGVDRGPLPHGSAEAMLLGGRNDLEAPAIAVAPAIGTVLASLGSQPGLRAARMSGSGATCFALFAGDADRAAAAATIRAGQPDWWCLETALA